MDVWGEIYKDHWKGLEKEHVIERDDGLLDTFSSAAHYFKAPRSKEEGELLDQLNGPVLDLGCGTGSYALYLQNRGLLVTAGDSSAGALEVAKARGCHDVRLLDSRNLEFGKASFNSIVIMGNTLGIQQDSKSLPTFLLKLHRITCAGGYLLCTTRDPLKTEDPVHLIYHQHNRDRGLSPGLTKMRMNYGEMVDDWVNLLLPTNEELDSAICLGGWKLIQRHLIGPNRIDLYEATP
jgi:SAM-dependent methyltransferase